MKVEFFFFCVVLTLYVHVHFMTGNRMQLDSLDHPDRPRNRLMSIHEEAFKSDMLEQHYRYCGPDALCTGKQPTETFNALRYGVNMEPNSTVCVLCMPCQCDELCFKYGDCCPDKLGIDRDMVDSVAHACVDPSVVSSRQSNSINRFLEIELYFMVSDCPENTTVDDVITNCSIETLHPPVTSTTSYLTYRNIFCAMCHNDSDSVIEWTASIMCDASHLSNNAESVYAFLKDIMSHDGCQINFIPPSNVDARKCSFVDFISECNVTGDWEHYDAFLELACESYTTMKIVESIVYKNVFCYICNMRKPSLDKKFCLTETDLVKNYSFSAKLNFPTYQVPMMLSRENLSESANCSVEEIYDSMKNECRSFLCPAGRYATNNTCLPFPVTAKGQGYVLNLVLLPVQRLSVPDLKDPLLNEINTQTKEFYAREIGEEAINMICWNISIGFFKKQKNMELDNISISFSFITSKFVNVADFERNIFKTFSTIASVDLKNKLLRFVPIDMSNGITTASIGDKASDEWHESNCEDVGNKTSIHQFLNISKLSLCKRFRLTSAEYYLSEARQLCINVSNICLHQLSFQLDHTGDAVLCVDDYLNIAAKDRSMSLYHWEKLSPQNSVEPVFILFMFFAIVSILSLILTLFVHVLFSELRTVLGKIHILLIIAIIFAQFFHIIIYSGLEILWICATFGVFCHYAWLVAFCCINVCCFHVFWKFFGARRTGSENNVKERYKEKLRYYILSSFIVPLIIVCLNILINIAVSVGGNYIDTGYGGIHCGFTSYIAMWLTLTTPLGLTVIASVTFYLTTRGNVQTLPEVEKQKNNCRHFLPYVLISVIFAFLWTLKIIQETSVMYVIEYSFAVANGAIGVCIMIILIWNRKVLSLIKELTSRSPDKAESATDYQLHERTSVQPEKIPASLSSETETNADV